MGNVSRQEKAELEEKVKRFIEKGIPEDLIQRTCNISKSTYYRIYRKVIKSILKRFEPREDDIQVYYVLLQKSFEDAYNINKQIMDDPKASNLERSRASELTCVARAQQLKFAETGPTFRPQLPTARTIEVKELPESPEHTSR